MALISCSECAHSISTQALTCPKCGSPQGEQPKKGNISGIHALLIILVPIVGLLMGLFMLNNPEEKENAPMAILLSVIVMVAYSVLLLLVGF